MPGRLRKIRDLREAAQNYGQGMLMGSVGPGGKGGGKGWGGGRGGGAGGGEGGRGRAARPERQEGRGGQEGRPEAGGVTAYHGSPHTCDQFDLSKIGTGEGARLTGTGWSGGQRGCGAVVSGYVIPRTGADDQLDR